MAKILVADDNSNIQKMVGLALKDQGIDVVAVGNGEAAVRKISDIHPDLVLADIFMPVRNGYEVCRYVKEDSSLAHIPVILLVGAFDPLDEQEAQRSGADGVLKKPFVPPDPLISMVKSALMRAGVPLGPATSAEKAPLAAKRSPTEILNAGVSSKLAALSAEKLPEVTAEPMEEFPTAPLQLKIDAGQGPLAFGSLLDTPEEEPILTSKPMIDLAQERKWTEESDEVEEEKEEAEESPRGGWHPGALEEEVEGTAGLAKGTPDWREEAFHGNSPAKSLPGQHWAPPIEAPAFAETAESQTVAVATVAANPVEGPVPFTGDAWAAAMAAGVEEKVAEVKDMEAAVPDPESERGARGDATAEVSGIVACGPEEVAEQAAPPAEEMKTPEGANCAAAPETTWEWEAKKASLLASTWDAPRTSSTEETQDVPVYAAEEPARHEESSDESPAVASAYSGEPVTASEAAGHEESAENEPVHEPGSQVPQPKSWENAWEAPVVMPAATVMEESSAEPTQLEERSLATAGWMEPAVEAPAVEPDMDELVARVLAKMNPEVLQKVTREILKPVIEAIVRDEINSKKS